MATKVLEQLRTVAPPARKELTATGGSIRVSELISALSYALDLTEGRPMGHSVRACLIGMRLGAALGLSPAALADLYYTLLMKDPLPAEPDVDALLRDPLPTASATANGKEGATVVNPVLPPTVTNPRMQT